MSEVLVIRLMDEPAQATWLVVGEQGQRLSNTQRSSLNDAAAYARDRDVVLLVPGLQATTTRVNLPVARASRVQQMLPFTLEDFVAEDVDKLMFAGGPKRGDGSMPVAIVAHDRIEQWLKLCHDADISPRAVYVDVQGVPETPGNATLMLDGQKIFGRLPDHEPFVFEELPLSEIAAMLASDDETAEICKNLVVYSDEQSYHLHETAIEQLRDAGTNVELSLSHDGILSRLAATLIATPGSNLLQGPYAIKSDWSQLMRPWRLPAALAAALLLVATLTLAGRYWVLSNEDEALAATLQSNCQSAFQTANLSACEAEIRTRLALSGDGSDDSADAGFLGTLSSVTAARDTRMVFRAISFRNGVTNLSIVAPDVQSLDSLATAIGSDGRLQANIQTTVPGNDGVEGRLQIAVTQ